MKQRVQEKIPGSSWKNRAYVGPEGRAGRLALPVLGFLSWSWPKVSLRVVSVVVLQTLIMHLLFLWCGDSEAAKAQTSDSTKASAHWGTFESVVVCMY